MKEAVDGLRRRWLAFCSAFNVTQETCNLNRARGALCCIVNSELFTQLLGNDWDDFEFIRFRCDF